MSALGEPVVRSDLSRLVEAVPRNPDQAQSAGSHDDYLARVAKYVPAEIVAFYLAGQSLIELATEPDEDRRRIAFAVLAAVLLICTPLYLRRAAEPGQPRRKHVIIGTLGFLVWVYALAGLPAAFNVYDSLAGGLTIILFTALSGVIVPVEGEP